VSGPHLPEVAICSQVTDVDSTSRPRAYSIAVRCARGFKIRENATKADPHNDKEFAEPSGRRQFAWLSCRLRCTHPASRRSRHVCDVHEQKPDRKCGLAQWHAALLSEVVGLPQTVYPFIRFPSVFARPWLRRAGEVCRVPALFLATDARPCYVGEGQARKMVSVRLHRGRGLLLSWFSYPAGGAGAASALRRKVSPSQTGRFAPPS
jgi:hypothetical protein